MKTPKAHRIISLTILFFLFITSLCSCEKQDSVKKQVLKDLRSLAKIEDFDNLSMSVYHNFSFQPIIVIHDPGSMENYIDQLHENLTFKLQGNEIRGRLDSFSTIKAEDIEVYNNCKPIEVRTYTVIKSSEDGKIFEFIWNAHNDNFIINGVEIVFSRKLLRKLQPLLYEHY